MFGFLSRLGLARAQPEARKAAARAERRETLLAERDQLDDALDRLEHVELPALGRDDPARVELLKTRAVLLGERQALENAIPKPVKQPGKRGGRYYYTKTGKLRYGERSAGRVAGPIAVDDEVAVGGVVPSVGHTQKSTMPQLLLFKAQKLQGRRELDGLGVSIEHRVGSIRYWTDHDGTEGRTKVRFAYGYLRGTRGTDGEEVDCFLGPLARDTQVDASTVYVVRTRKPPEFLEADEDKCMIGWPDLESARAAFLAHYSNDARFIDQIDAVPWDDFKAQARATKDGGGFIRGDVVERPGLTKAHLVMRFFSGMRARA